MYKTMMLSQLFSGFTEIKLGGDKLIAEGVKTLIALSDKIDTTRMKKPSFLMVR